MMGDWPELQQRKNPSENGERSEPPNSSVDVLPESWYKLTMDGWYEFLGATEVDEKGIRARIFGSLPRISGQRRSKPQRRRGRYKQMELVGDSRYKYSNEQWVVSAKAHYHHGASKQIWHADGVKTGTEWMESQISFDHFKITTELETTDATMIPLVTMQKYVPLLSYYYY